MSDDDIYRHDREIAALRRDVELGKHERALHTAHQQQWLAELIAAKAERDALRLEVERLKAQITDMEKRWGDV